MKKRRIKSNPLKKGVRIRRIILKTNLINNNIEVITTDNLRFIIKRDRNNKEHQRGMMIKTLDHYPSLMMTFREGVNTDIKPIDHRDI